MLKPYQSYNNYYALFEAWTLLAANIIRYTHVMPLNKKYWSDSLNLAKLEIINTLTLLKNEVLEKNDLNGMFPFMDNKTIYGVRSVITLGSISALENFLRKNNTNYTNNNKLLTLIKHNLKKFVFWGESAFPYYFNLIKYLENSQEEKLALEILEKLFSMIITKNSPNKFRCFPSPYYDVEMVLENLLKLDIERDQEIELRLQFLEDPRLNLKNALKKSMEEFQNDVDNAILKKFNLDEAFSIISKSMDWKDMNLHEFSGSSYILKSLLFMLVKRKRKYIIKNNWPILSRIRFEEFKPKNMVDYFSWMTKNGINISKEPKRIQSWADLVSESNILKNNRIFLENSDLLNFFSIVAPHRAVPDVVKFLDQYYD